MTIELNRIYNEDCLEGMKRIPDGSVDCIICDLPYGNMKGAALDGWSENDTIWDEQLDIDQMFVQYERVLKRNGNLILFSQEPYTSKLRSYNCNNIEFSYPLIWLKDHFANALIARKAPVSYFEDISVFYKRHDTQCLHPLREYFSHVLEYIGSLKVINKVMGNRKAVHSFYVAGKKEVIDKIGGSADHVCRLGSSQFSLCTEDTYNKLIELFHIDNMQGFKSYIEPTKVKPSSTTAWAVGPPPLPPSARSGTSSVSSCRKNTSTSPTSESRKNNNSYPFSKFLSL